MKRFLWAFLTILAFLVVFDIGGVIVCFVMDVLSIGFAVFYYTVWLVAGAFCGLLSYDSAGRRLTPITEGDWSNTLESGKSGLIVLSMTASVLLVLTGILFKVEWNPGDTQSPYVPDSMPLTLTFFIAVLGSMIGGHKFLRPERNKSE